MDISAVEAKLNGLLNEIDSIPAVQAGKILLLAQKSKPVHPKFAGSDAIEQSLDHLRLVIKYLLFDVEATRRENKYLRKMLESRED